MSMTLSLNQSQSFSKAVVPAQVGAYLANVTYIMGAKSDRKESEQAAEKYMAENPMNIADKKTALETIKGMEKQLKKEARKASFDTKLEYALGRKGAEIARAVAFGSAAVIGSVMAANGMDRMATPAFIFGAAAISTAGRAISMPPAEKTEQEALKQYADVKRAQFALKQMKRQLDPKPSYKDEVRALYASGLGNPGGMITALNLKKQNGR